MTEHETINPDACDPYGTSTQTLWTHATAVAEQVRTITESWLATYGAGDCSPYQIVVALYACHQPLHEAIAVLEHAKQCCRQAMEQPLLALHAPVELPGQATLRWVPATHTASYASKTVAAIMADLHANLLPLLPSLDTLSTLLPIITTAQAEGVLSDDDAEALSTTIHELACGCRAAQEAARRLQDARTEGTRVGYTKIEACRLTQSPDIHSA